ncbi:MAG: hypothetical protein D6712_09675 [Chloroflexi bacterium]|nr:MAG: hypothetical protein D6712_09675 [Chloroflexota bacterium]
MADQKVQVVLEWALDRQKAQETLRYHDQLSEKLEKVRSRINEVKGRFDELEEVSGRVAALSAAAFAPLILSASNYVEKVGQAETISRRWLVLSERQQRAQIELGRKSAEALLPYRELLIEIVELAAGVDQDIIKAGVAGAGVLAGAAALGLLVSQLGKVYTGLLLLNTTMQQLVATQVGGAVARTTGGLVAGAAGVGIGIAATRGIGEISGDERLQRVGLNDLLVYLFDILKTFVAALALGAKLIEEQFSSLRKKLELAILSIKEAFGKIPDVLRQIIDGLLLAFSELIRSVPAVGGAAADALGIDEEALRRRLRAGQSEPIVDTEAVQAILSGAGLNESTQRFIGGRIAETDSLDELNELLKQLEYQTFITAETADQIRNTLVGTERERLEVLKRADERQQAIDERYAFVGSLLASFDEVLRPRIENLGLPSLGGGGAGGGGRVFNEPILDAFEQLQVDLENIQNSYNKQRVDNQKRFAASLLNLEKQAQAQRLAIQQNYKDDLAALDKEAAEAERNYRVEVAALREDAQRQELDAQERFERDRRRILEQFNEQLRDAVLNRDARAAVSAFRQRRQQERDLGENVQQERRQRAQANAERLQDLVANFEREKQARAERRKEIENAYHEQMRDLENNLRAQERELREAYRQQQRDLQVALNSEILQRRQAFNRQLLELTEFQNAESRIRQQHYEQLNAQLTQYLLNGASAQAQAALNTASQMINGAVRSITRSNSVNVGGININGAQDPARVASLVEERIVNIFRTLVD